MEYENMMTIQELSKFLPDHPSKATIYAWTCHRKIPFTKMGKKIFFEKEKIIKWNEDGRPED